MHVYQLDDFPNLNALWPDFNRFKTQSSMNDTDHLVLRAISDKIGRHPCTRVLEFLRSIEVSSSQLFILRLCEFWSADLYPLSIAWRQNAHVAEILAPCFPDLDLGDGGRRKGLLKKMSGVAGKQRLRFYTKALVKWILWEDTSDGKIQTIVDKILENGKILGMHDVACSYLRRFHPYFDEMHWANSIVGYLDRECARFVTMQKYYVTPAVEHRIYEALFNSNIESRFLDVKKKYPFVRKEYLLDLK